MNKSDYTSLLNRERLDYLVLCGTIMSSMGTTPFSPLQVLQKRYLRRGGRG